MQRSDRGLRLWGRELDALVRIISGLELRRIPAQSFPPADRVIAGVGHLLRRYADPRAWLVEAAFRMDLPPIVIKGPLATMDSIARMVELELPAVREDLPPPSVNFLYRGLGGDPWDDPAVADLPGRRHLSAGDLASLLDHDAQHENLWAAHLALAAASWAELIQRNVEARIFVDADPPTVVLFGAAYTDIEDPGIRSRRSPLETGLSFDRRSIPKPVAAAADELPLRAGGEEIARWVDRRLAEGWLLVRDFGAAGVVYDLCALSSDGAWAIGAQHAGDHWVRSPAVPLGPNSLTYARTLLDMHVRRGSELL